MGGKAIQRPNLILIRITMYKGAALITPINLLHRLHMMKAPTVFVEGQKGVNPDDRGWYRSTRDVPLSCDNITDQRGTAV